MEHARLDVVFDDWNGRRIYVDVEICDAATITQSEQRARALRDGAAAARAEDVKRRRYPGPDLAPFVLEAKGRAGDSALALLKAACPDDAAELGAARQSLSVQVQLRNADLLLAAIR